MKLWNFFFQFDQKSVANSVRPKFEKDWPNLPLDIFECLFYIYLSFEVADAVFKRGSIWLILMRLGNIEIELLDDIPDVDASPALRTGTLIGRVEPLVQAVRVEGVTARGCCDVGVVCKEIGADHTLGPHFPSLINHGAI